MYPEPDFTKEIVGGSLGGLALLALLTAGLYKVRHCAYTTSVYHSVFCTKLTYFHYVIFLHVYDTTITEDWCVFI